MAIPISQTKPLVMLRLALLQFLATLVFSLGIFCFYDIVQALSALFGGLVACIASLFAAGRLFFSAKPAKQQPAEQILARFYVSEILKIILTLALMAIFIIVIKVSILPFIIAYLLSAMIVNWLVLLFAETETA